MCPMLETKRECENCLLGTDLYHGLCYTLIENKSDLEVKKICFLAFLYKSAGGYCCHLDVSMGVGLTLKFYVQDFFK